VPGWQRREGRFENIEPTSQSSRQQGTHAACASRARCRAALALAELDAFELKARRVLSGFANSGG